MRSIILLIILYSYSCFAQSVLELDQFVEQISKRQSKVEEFRYIKKVANSLGIKHVYMFGGTAAAWGHYVRWDMRRELGIEKLQPERFDYDYTKIFRANQDFDVVIDGSLLQAEALESAVQKHFNYFSGTRPTWEVRLLNEQRADKDPIMGDDFQNQHTDSHSTGLIEMMDCEGFDCIKDVRDIENPQNAFLMDMFEAKLHYYFSHKHTSTLRYRNGMNPEILSVIRYFTKAVQYELEMREADTEQLKKIISNFNPGNIASLDKYVVSWLNKNAKKLIINAVDMEYAQNLIEAIGLKQKLIKIGNSDTKDTMPWWLSKEALKTSPLGYGSGKKASEIFNLDENAEIIVSHETNSFPAFESITKSHDGSPNVLISRKEISGENAVFGEGHYVRLGREGAVGSGLTIRYKLNPNAREGSDFTVHKESNQRGTYILIKNKAALEVIYESLSFEVEDYFSKIAKGLEFDFNDKGVVEKLNRSMVRKLAYIETKKLNKIMNIIKSSLGTGKINWRLMQAWIKTPLSGEYVDIYKEFVGLVKKELTTRENDPEIEKTIIQFFHNIPQKQLHADYLDVSKFIYTRMPEQAHIMPISVLKYPELMTSEVFPTLMEHLFSHGEHMYAVSMFLLSSPLVSQSENFESYIYKYIEAAKLYEIRNLSINTFIKPEVMRLESFERLVQAYLRNGGDRYELERNVYSTDIYKQVQREKHCQSNYR